jgi:IS1 family transposase
MSTTGLKKTNPGTVESLEELELDELYWFVGRKPSAKTRENVYIMTAVSRNPRQIRGFAVSLDKSSPRIQAMVDAAPDAEKYFTDGYAAYLDVIYPGQHIQNIRDKSSTFTVESVNADLRHYIPVLARRSRCFARKLETLQAVMDVFVDAYNRFGAAKSKYRRNRNAREVPFSVLDFL